MVHLSTLLIFKQVAVMLFVILFLSCSSSSIAVFQVFPYLFSKVPIEENCDKEEVPPHILGSSLRPLEGPSNSDQEEVPPHVLGSSLRPLEGPSNSDQEEVPPHILGSSLRPLEGPSNSDQEEVPPHILGSSLRPLEGPSNCDKEEVPPHILGSSLRPLEGPSNCDKEEVPPHILGSSLRPLEGPSNSDQEEVPPHILGSSLRPLEGPSNSDQEEVPPHILGSSLRPLEGPSNCEQLPEPAGQDLDHFVKAETHLVNAILTKNTKLISEKANAVAELEITFLQKGRLVSARQKMDIDDQITRKYFRMQGPDVAEYIFREVLLAEISYVKESLLERHSEFAYRMHSAQGLLGLLLSQRMQKAGLLPGRWKSGYLCVNRKGYLDVLAAEADDLMKNHCSALLESLQLISMDYSAFGWPPDKSAQSVRLALPIVASYHEEREVTALLHYCCNCLASLLL